MVPRSAEDGQLLPDGVEIAEGLIPVFVGGSFGEVAAEDGKVHLGVFAPGFHNLFVRDAAQGVLHIAEIEERKVLVHPGVARHETVPRRTLAACHHAIAIALPVVEVGEPRHVVRRFAAARSEDFARGGNVDNGRVVFVAQLQIRGL